MEKVVEGSMYHLSKRQILIQISLGEVEYILFRSGDDIHERVNRKIGMNPAHNEMPIENWYQFFNDLTTITDIVDEHDIKEIVKRDFPTLEEKRSADGELEKKTGK